MFIAPLGAWLSLDAGAFEELEFDLASQTVTLTIVPSASGISGAAAAPKARWVAENTADNELGVLKPTTSLSQDAGAWVIPFKNGVASVKLGF